jgi:hypothetical protein
VSAEQTRELWQAPQAFRDAVEDLETISGHLVDMVDGQQLLVPAADVAFLARRLSRLATEVHRALPAEVT